MPILNLHLVYISFLKNKVVFSHNFPFEKNYRTYFQDKDTSYYFKPFLNKNTTISIQIEYALYNKNLCVSYGKHLFIVSKYKVKAHRIFKSIVTKLKYDRSGNLWVCTYNNGVYSFPDSRISVDAKFNLLKDRTITSFYQDNAGAYWISTMKNGVYYIPSLNFNIKDELVDNFVNNIVAGNNKIWYSTGKNKLGYFDSITKKQYNLSNSSTFKISDLIYDVNKKELWGGFERFAGFFYINFETDTFITSISKNETKITVKSLLLNKSTIIVGGSAHLSFFRNKNYTCVLTKKFKIPAHTIHFGKANNEIWIGNRDGLYFFKNDSITYFGEKNELFKKRVVKLIYERSNDLLWVATKDSGIYMVKDDIVKSITENEGLSGNNITALYVKNNKVWVGTTNGLDQITITDQEKHIYEIQHFNENKGLVSNIINDIAVIEPVVYIATNKGISFFNYKNVKKNYIAPPIYITDIKINNKDTVLQDSYILPYGLNNIDIKYVGLSYKAPKEVTYQYQLEGLHAEIQTTFSNNLEFSLLPPGRYNFKIYAVNEDGIRSKEPKEIQFIIKPPFYMTWWFIGFIALLLIFITGSIFRIINRIKLKEIRKRNQVEKNLIKERQKALGQQMNPHFIFNTLSSIQNYLYKNDRIFSSVYLEKFSQLMRNTLYNSQEEFILLKDELKSLSAYLELEQIRLNNKFEFKIETDNEIDIYLIKIPAFLIQPYVENSVWHGIN